MLEWFSSFFFGFAYGRFIFSHWDRAGGAAVPVEVSAGQCAMLLAVLIVLLYSYTMQMQMQTEMPYRDGV